MHIITTNMIQRWVLWKFPNYIGTIYLNFQTQENFKIQSPFLYYIFWRLSDHYIVKRMNGNITSEQCLW